LEAPENDMETAAPTMTIGRLSKRTGCKVETIRYYERAGLLAPFRRSGGGHRQYDRAALKRLNFVLRARKLGFSLHTVRALLTLADGEGGTCQEAARIATGHLADVRAKQDDLAAMESVLSEMVARCAGGTTPECPLIEALFADDAPGRWR